MYKAELPAKLLMSETTRLGTSGSIKKQSWSPYNDNGGSICCITGKGFCLLIADTRLSTGNDRCLITGGGMHADRMQLDKLVHEHCRLYEYNNFQPISVEAIAAFVSVRLYSRRFFPYYVFTAVAGLDENGDGVLYSYDPVGSYQRTEYGAEGSGRVLANSLLDNQAGLKGSHFERTDLSLGDALELLKTTFIALNERDIYTGDTAEVWILTADGVETREFELKKD